MLRAEIYALTTLRAVFLRTNQTSGALSKLPPSPLSATLPRRSVGRGRGEEAVCSTCSVRPAAVGGAEGGRFGTGDRRRRRRRRFPHAK